MDTTQASLTGLASLEEPNVQQLLLEAYSDIGEPDSVYGVCASKTVSKETWMRLYEHEGKWEKSLSEMEGREREGREGEGREKGERREGGGREVMYISLSQVLTTCRCSCPLLAVRLTL